MKKISLAIILLLVLALAFAPAAYAEEVNLGTVSLGQNVYIFLGVVPNGANYSVGAYPPNDLRVTQSPAEGGTGLYLEGVAAVAGNHSFSIVNHDSGASTVFHISVDAAASQPSGAQAQTPQLAVSSDVICYEDERALLSAAAYVSDGGVLSYQWYSANSPVTSGGYPIPGATSAEYLVNTSDPGQAYYYCVVTNSLYGSQTSANTPAISVTVIDSPDIVNLSLYSPPAKLMYKLGESLDPTGLSLIAYYSNGDERLITEGFTCSPSQFTAPGQNNVTVNYEGWLCTFPVTVNEAGVESIVVVSMPDRSTYTQGEMLSTSGMVLRVYSAGGAYQDIREGFTCSPTQLSAIGSQTVTVSYKGQTCTFSVTVREAVRSLEVSSTPVKLSYKVGEKLDTTGLVVKLSSGGTVQTLSAGFSCEPTVFGTPGTQTVTVRYGQLSTSFTVSVSAAPASPTPSAAGSSASAEPGQSSPQVSPTPRPVIRQDKGPSRAVLVAVMIAAIICLIILGTLFVWLNRKPARRPMDDDRRYDRRR